MGSISGFAVLGDGRPWPPFLAREFHDILLGGLGRGSDSFELVVISREGGVKPWRGVCPPTKHQVEQLVGVSPSVAIASSRSGLSLPGEAEPYGVPTWAGHGWAVAHEGEVVGCAGGRFALAARPRAGADSSMLAAAFASSGFEQALAGFDGSFALAAVECSQPRRLHLARSYRPLCLMRHPDLPVVFFASTEDQLIGGTPGDELDLNRPRVQALAPHHLVVLDARDGSTTLRALPVRHTAGGRRALLLASGGLDSTVAATMLRRHHFEVTLVHFSAGERGEGPDLQAAKAVATALQCELRVAALDWRSDGLAAGAWGRERVRAGGVGPEPAAKMMMIASACAIADAEGFSHVALGGSAEQPGGCPASSHEFVAAMDRASQLGTLNRARVVSPVGNLLKHQVVRLGAATDAPLELTWSCARSGDLHCGACEQCLARRAAFEASGVPDRVRYETDLIRLRLV